MGNIEPKVGMGVTIFYATDSVAGTIVRVTRSQIHVQRDTATRTDHNGMSEAQTYAYTQNPDALVEIYRRTRDGWRNMGKSLAIGVRKQYRDFSF